MSAIIGVDIEGEVQWHVTGVLQDYSTLCGLDADDPAIGHHGTRFAVRGQKVTCEQCKAIWFGIRALRLRASRFE